MVKIQCSAPLAEDKKKCGAHKKKKFSDKPCNVLDEIAKFDIMGDNYIYFIFIIVLFPYIKCLKFNFGYLQKKQFK